MYWSKKIWKDEDSFIETTDCRVVKRVSVEENRAPILLHEVADVTGRLSDDRKNQQLSDEFNQDIAKDCFGKN